MSGRMSAETEHGLGLLDSDELQSLTPPPPSAAAALQCHDGGAPVVSAANADWGSTADEGGQRVGAASSVLGNAVQHDLDAFDAETLPPLPLPAPDSGRKATVLPHAASPVTVRPAASGRTTTPSQATPNSQQKRRLQRGSAAGGPPGSQIAQHTGRAGASGSRIPSAAASPARTRAAASVPVAPAQRFAKTTVTVHAGADKPRAQQAAAVRSPHRGSPAFAPPSGGTKPAPGRSVLCAYAHEAHKVLGTAPESARLWFMKYLLFLRPVSKVCKVSWLRNDILACVQACGRTTSHGGTRA